MAQKTFVDGDVLTASDINTYLAGEGGAWTSWSPAVTQLGSVTVTNTRSRYARWGRLIHVTVQLSVTGSGTGSNAIFVTLPVTAATSAQYIAGAASLFDISDGLEYRGLPYLASTGTWGLSPTNTNVTGYMGVVDFTAGLASGDLITAAFSYEAAS